MFSSVRPWHWLLLLIVGLSTYSRIIDVQPVYRSGEMNADEERNYRIALNHLSGKGYTIDGKQTSFHSSLPVFVYEWLIRNDIPKSTYIKSIHYLSIFLFIPALVALYLMVCGGGGHAVAGLLAVASFAYYPSNTLYIGPLFWYEKVAMPVLIMVVYLFWRLLDGSKARGMVVAISVLTISLCLVRNQMLVILGISIGLMGFAALAWPAQRRALVKVVVAVTVGIGLALVVNIPVFQKNHAQFGKYVLSTQAGFELMQGHSAMARGSWCGSWNTPGSLYETESRKVIPNLYELNELEESEARQKLAIRWALTHPLQEIKLSARKLAIFMLPINFQGGMHWSNVAVHVLFVLALAWISLHRQWNKILLLLAFPIVADMLMCILFFTDMRWRYYAEPFMIAIALVGVSLMAERVVKRLGFSVRP